MTTRYIHSPLTIAVSGLAALAVAMGIGRFAFTPILPMMQTDHGTSVAQGGWLASANYLGYLAGSLVAMHPGIPTRAAIRWGLVLIAVCTLAMGVDHHLPAWLILRGVAGLGSALVMIAVSAWILPRLAHAARENLSGTVYAGVGAGIAYAGAACLVLLQVNASADAAWILLGMTAAIVTVCVWRILGALHDHFGAARASLQQPCHLDRRQSRDGDWRSDSNRTAWLGRYRNRRAMCRRHCDGQHHDRHPGGEARSGSERALADRRDDVVPRLRPSQSFVS